MTKAKPSFAFRAALRAVKTFDMDQCRAAMSIDGLHATVRQAIERRMRKLEKEARHA